MKDLLQIFFFSKSVSGSVQGHPCPFLRGYIESFQISLKGFQKFSLFWVAGMILEAWDVQLESAHSSMFQLCL